MFKQNANRLFNKDVKYSKSLEVRAKKYKRGAGHLGDGMRNQDMTGKGDGCGVKAQEGRCFSRTLTDAERACLDPNRVAQDNSAALLNLPAG
jgi:hypothetical protein